MCILYVLHQIKLYMPREYILKLGLLSFVLALFARTVIVLALFARTLVVLPLSTMSITKDLTLFVVPPDIFTETA